MLLVPPTMRVLFRFTGTLLVSPTGVASDYVINKQFFWEGMSAASKGTITALLSMKAGCSCQKHQGSQRPRRDTQSVEIAFRQKIASPRTFHFRQSQIKHGKPRQNLLLLKCPLQYLNITPTFTMSSFWASGWVTSVVVLILVLEFVFNLLLKEEIDSQNRISDEVIKQTNKKLK